MVKTVQQDTMFMERLCNLNWETFEVIFHADFLFVQIDVTLYYYRYLQEIKKQGSNNDLTKTRFITFYCFCTFEISRV